MNISAKAEYAVRAAVQIAANGGKPMNADAIARATGLPFRFTEQILGILRRAGIIATKRGGAAGYLLTRDAAEITVADIMRASDGPLLSVRRQRPDEVAYAGAATSLGQVWIAMGVAIRSVIEHVTLHDLATGSLPAQVQELIRDPDAWLTRAQSASSPPPVLAPGP